MVTTQMNNADILSQMGKRHLQLSLPPNLQGVKKSPNKPRSSRSEGVVSPRPQVLGRILKDKASMHPESQ